MAGIGSEEVGGFGTKSLDEKGGVCVYLLISFYKKIEK